MEDWKRNYFILILCYIGNNDQSNSWSLVRRRQMKKEKSVVGGMDRYWTAITSSWTSAELLQSSRHQLLELATK